MRSRTGYAELVTCGLVWGSIGVLVKQSPVTAPVIVFFRLALGAAVVFAWLAFRGRLAEARLRGRRLLLVSSGFTLALHWVFFFLATASHGFLDSMTNGGLGVAFFAPFSNIRYFLRWRPIVVSPISVYGFVGRRGLIVMWSELGWVWLPAALIFLAGLALRRSTPREAVETNGGRSS